MENESSRMTELDEAWELALAEAKRRARAAGRTDIAEYLSLRARNDLLRRTGTEWLVSSLTRLAGEANRRGAGIQIEQQEAHRFRVGSTTMVGTRLTLRNGVRALTVESGWPRTPRDGFIRGGGLACANLKHFGRPRANAELTLMRAAKGAPLWIASDKTGAQTRFSEGRLRDHFLVLLGES
jgi:hypothetical protein